MDYFIPSIFESLRLLQHFVIFGGTSENMTEIYSENLVKNY